MDLMRLIVSFNSGRLEFESAMEEEEAPGLLESLSDGFE
jgi:hypothetical protein